MRGAILLGGKAVIAPSNGLRMGFAADAEKK